MKAGGGVWRGMGQADMCPMWRQEEGYGVHVLAGWLQREVGMAWAGSGEQAVPAAELQAGAGQGRRRMGDERGGVGEAAVIS